MPRGQGPIFRIAALSRCREHSRLVRAEHLQITCDNRWLDILSSRGQGNDVDYRSVITIEPDKRSGQPCIRGLRMTVHDVLDYLASGMTHAEILSDFPDLTFISLPWLPRDRFHLVIVDPRQKPPQNFPRLGVV